MPEQTLFIPMTEAEARSCVQQIKAKMADARRLARELYERQGWKALGYASFQACAEVEFGYSFQHVYRMVDAAQLEDELMQHSPVGETRLPMPERHLRVLKQLNTPAERVAADLNARQMAHSEGVKVPTTKHYVTSVQLQQQKTEVFKTKYHIVGYMVTMGEITVPAAKDMTERLEKLKPRIRGEVVRVMAQHGIACPELITEIGQMIDRPVDKPSLTLQTILATGRLAGTPLKQATMSDLKRARAEAQQQHLSEALEKERETKNIIPVIITVYRGDPGRTLKALVQALSEDDLDALKAALEVRDAERQTANNVKAALLELQTALDEAIKPE